MPDQEAKPGYEILGPQNDGEPAVVTEAAPEAAPKAEPAPEPEKPEGEAKPEGTPEQPHKKPGSVRARERAEREATLRVQAERERDELKAKLEAASKPPVADPEEPVLDNFESLEAWKAALVAHAQKKAADKVSKDFEAKQQQTAMQEAQKKWQEADAKFAETKPDWDDVLEDLTDAVRSLPPECEPGFNAIGAALNTSSVAPAIKYHLGQHPEELKRIASLDPISAVKEMAKLEIRLTGPEPAPQKPRTTNAPPPVNPLSGTSTVTPPAHRRDTYVEIQ